MPIDKRWATLSPAQWDDFAQAWIAELRDPAEDSERSLGSSIVMMNFTAPPELQWQFILTALKHAGDNELGHIAAGPLEHLLGKHGAQHIDRVEYQARADPKFARMLVGVRKYTMSDDVWARIEQLKAETQA